MLAPTDEPVFDCPIPAIFAPFLQPARFKVAEGGRGSSKTRSVITILVNNVMWSGWRVVCFRELMEAIAESSYQEIVEEIDRRNLGAFFDITKTEISCPSSGGVFKFSGIRASSKRLQNQKLKGFSNFDAAFIDEGESITKDSWNALVPTMRKAGSEIYVCFNPASPLDFIYQAFVAAPIYPAERNGKPYCITLKVNYTDNPFFPKELADDAELMRQADPELYRHVYLGEPVADSALAIIKPMWIEAATDAHKHIPDFPTGGGKIGGMDVSGGQEGDVVAPKANDPNAVAWRYGCTLAGLEEWQDENPNAAAAHGFTIVQRERIDTLNIDNIGVGASVPGEMRRLQAEASKRNAAVFKGRVPRLDCLRVPLHGRTRVSARKDPRRHVRQPQGAGMGHAGRPLPEHLAGAQWAALRSRPADLYPVGAATPRQASGRAGATPARERERAHEGREQEVAEGARHPLAQPGRRGGDGVLDGEGAELRHAQAARLTAVTRHPAPP